MNEYQGKKILVMVAHPDDEVLGCGGTIAQHTSRGDTVWVCILGEGVMSRTSFSEREKEEQLKQLQGFAKKASSILGVQRVIFKNFPDNAFDRVARLDIIHEVESIFKTFQPQIVYTHHQSDVNIDHQYSVEIVQALCRPLPRSSIESVFSFEIPSSTEWNYVKADLFRPNVFIELSEELMKKKIEALEAYASELRQFPHPRSLEYIRALAQVRGGQAGFDYAEAFQLVYIRYSRE
ncbi:PIG-L family deacetylase [Candidatus Uhrbacteria bacterium]|nr:PIG-L family deacetylase [Candidatus Uhrbacteria bacterium]